MAVCSESSTTDSFARRIDQSIRRALASLRTEFGPQGWWPVRCERGEYRDKTSDLSARGYHPGQFGFPRTARGRWEVVCGAVLTQNTAWRNVERAIDGLEAAGIAEPGQLLAMDPSVLGQIIRPAGYFNQKTSYLRAVGMWFTANDGRLSQAPKSRATLERERCSLLSVRGVGPETADSVLLYAYHLPTFVVDAYTRRVLGGAGLIDAQAPYEEIRRICERATGRPRVGATVRAYQEAHALIVEQAKRLVAGQPRRRSGHSALETDRP